jgi:arabinan endo-1,5-alpha-L-arabinosidase
MDLTPFRPVRRPGVRLVLLAVLAVAGLTAAPVAGSTASASPSATSAPAASPASVSPAAADAAGGYENPILPRVPGDGAVESCADPMVLRGQQPGDRHWYMYCTTDPLNDEDLDANGDLVFHRVPMMRSTDLVNWTYVGDAFDRPPAWADRSSALWAPDVVYSKAFDRYYMFFVATNAADAVSGEPGCNGDSAIGVATSSSPTGPWDFSDEPVVSPRRAGAGCNFFWTFDPDVLGDAVGTSSTLYYGSYFGGVFGTELSLTEDGAVASPAATRIAIGNRYEGTTVVQRNGFYYAFASATNCCAGPLTGYSVFVGRSRSPLGPFVDREGDSFLAGRVGGTPALSMNGNRWVGTGHNSVFTDAAGQWWTMYHAVDQGDPYFETEPGFTKRPAMLDPVDWRDGWPTVRGGLWASDGPMPAPAAQPGDPAAYRPAFAVEDAVGDRVPQASDEFDGRALRPDWRWVRREAAAGDVSIADGMLTWRTHGGDLARDSDTAPVLTRSAPAGDYVVETKVRLDVPPEGCCHNYVQAGLALYADDDRYLKHVHVSIWETRQTEFAKEVPDAGGAGQYGNTVVGAPGDWTYVRLAVERLGAREQQQAGGDTERYTAYTSQDGRRWVRGGTWTHRLGQAGDIGLVSMGGRGFTAAFDYVRVSRLRGGSLIPTP